MEATRREFLKYGAAGLAAVGAYGLVEWAPRAESQEIALDLFIIQGNVPMVDGTPVFMRTFATAAGQATLPGPLIKVLEGDLLTIGVRNTLSEPHSLLVRDVVDSGPIAPGASTVVRFEAPSAGTYLYQDGVDVPVNRLLGLHGALMTMPGDGSSTPYRGGPSFTRQYVWVLSDVDPAWGELARAERAIDGSTFLPRYFTINGKSGIDSIEDTADNIRPHGRVGERCLVRMLNAGLAVHAPHFHGNHPTLLTRDGRVLDLQMVKDTFYLGPEERKDVLQPYDLPDDAVPRLTPGTFTELNYPVHCHAEMSQTAAGGLYPGGMVTDWTLEG